MKIIRSNRTGKRFAAHFNNGIITHFGLSNPKVGTYIDHHNIALRNAYIARHEPLENWNDPYAAGTLSRFILWGNSPNIQDNIREYKIKFHL